MTPPDLAAIARSEERDLRLECLRLAIAKTGTAIDAILAAGRLYAFVVGEGATPDA